MVIPGCRVGPCEKTRSQGVGIVNHRIFAGNIGDTNCVPVRNRRKVVHDVFAGAYCNAQILV